MIETPACRSPTVSVVIPTLNAAPYLAALLDGIFSQRPLAPIEVVLVDSLSTDATAAIAASDPRVRIVPIANFSHGRARNVGAREARGEIVVLLTQDAVPADRSWLAHLLAPFEDPQVVAAYSRQIPRPDANPMERFFLMKRFPPGPPLIAEARASTVVDATHPYASAITENAQRAAARAGVPYLRYLRAPAVASSSGVIPAVDHEEAARSAFLFGRPVLLTIGTRHLAPYLRESRRTSVPVVARVLPAPASLRACEQAGLASDRVIPGLGPFSVEQNIEVIRRHGIGVLVTKDGGAAGGVPEKLEAARREGCEVVVVARPAETTAAGRTFDDIAALVAACTASTGS